MTGGCGQPRAQRVELVVQPLLGLLPVSDQPAPVTDRGTQFLNHGLLGLPTTGALTGEVGQRGTPLHH